MFYAKKNKTKRENDIKNKKNGLVCSEEKAPVIS